jgi:hypothetical protein
MVLGYFSGLGYWEGEDYIREGVMLLRVLDFKEGLDK